MPQVQPPRRALLRKTTSASRSPARTGAASARRCVDTAITDRRADRVPGAWGAAAFLHTTLPPRPLFIHSTRPAGSPAAPSPRPMATAEPAEPRSTIQPALTLGSRPCTLQHLVRLHHQSCPGPRHLGDPPPDGRAQMASASRRLRERLLRDRRAGAEISLAPPVQLDTRHTPRPPSQRESFIPC